MLPYYTLLQAKKNTSFHQTKQNFRKQTRKKNRPQNNSDREQLQTTGSVISPLPKGNQCLLGWSNRQNH